MLLAVGYHPLNGQVDRNAVWDAIGQVANAVLIQRHWRADMNPGGLDFHASLAEDVAEARRRGLKVIIAFELLAADRRRLELPANLTGDFASTDVKNAYLALLQKAAAEYRPDVFVVNVEANLYKKHDPQGYANWVTGWRWTYQMLKSQNSSPSTKYCVSLSYSDYDGANCLDPGDLVKLKLFAADYAGYQDLLAISLYPTCYGDPYTIPTGLLEGLSSISSLPLFIAETGWPSEPFQITPDTTFPASQEAQRAYIEKLRAMAGSVSNLAGITYISIVDPEDLVCQAIVQSYPALGWYCTLSVLDKQGAPKAAYSAMKTWRGGAGSPPPGKRPPPSEPPPIEPPEVLPPVPEAGAGHSMLTLALVAVALYAATRWR
ncbi:MAG: hypothetical protein EPO21_13170 [Chloroflexota bacterium]|nr:MAG: hypothetical protein EPO21_13170 [Chloroflexota bacterium]